MVQVTIVDRAGVARALNARPGLSLMESAVAADVDGIDADCRGACACATCHVHVDPAWTAIVGPPNPLEAELLPIAEQLQPNSRLSCQIRVHEGLEGLLVRVPRDAG